MQTKSYLTSEFFSRNRKKLREAFGGTAPIVLSANGLMQRTADGAYPFTQESNFWYVTGITEPGLILVLEVDKEYLILPKSNPVRDVFDGNISPEVLSVRSGIEQILGNEEGWKLLEKRAKKVKHIATLHPPAVYIEQLEMFTNGARAALVNRLTASNKHLKLIDIRPYITHLRSIKTSEEIVLMKLAASETKRLYTIIDKKLNTTHSENEIMAHISSEIIKRQLEFAYDPIIASGKNALTLHYISNNDQINTEDFLLLDLGVKIDGYCADVTRTVVPKPSKRQRQVYEAVRSVKEYAHSIIKPDVILADYEKEIVQFMGEKLRELGLIKSISNESVRTFYPHATSHFLGIDAHDPGEYAAPLAPGMVITIEPGIYIEEENTAVRLEDFVVITQRGSKNLSAQIPLEIDRLA